VTGVATRPDTNSDFLLPTPVTVLNTSGNETDVMLVADQSELFYASDVSGISQILHVERTCGAAQTP
jgi:hypothetical protein